MADQDPTEVNARLFVDGDQISGEVIGPDGRRVQFSGWLGLMGAIEAACERVPPSEIAGS